VTPLIVLLLATGASEPPVVPAITIDPCVEVDAEEVRRLAAIELGSKGADGAWASLEVVVVCEGGLQQIRVDDRESGTATTRSIDLSGPLGDDRDAKPRELALAIAELIRRAEVKPAPQPEPPKPAPAPPPPPPPAPRPVATPEPDPWRLELGLSGTAVTFTGGETLFGANLGGRVRLGRAWLASAHVGGRRTRELELGAGSLDGHGVSADVGLAFDLAPSSRGAGIALGARVGVDWLRYTAVDPSGVGYGGGDGTAAHAAGVVTAFLALSRPLCLTTDLAAGGAFHSVALRDNGELISRAGGAIFSVAVGLAAQF